MTSLHSLINSVNYGGALKDRVTFSMGYSLTMRKSVVEVVCIGQQAFSSGETEIVQVDLRLASSPLGCR